MVSGRKGSWRGLGAGTGNGTFHVLGRGGGGGRVGDSGAGGGGGEGFSCPRWPGKGMGEIAFFFFFFFTSPYYKIPFVGGRFGCR